MYTCIVKRNSYNRHWPLLAVPIGIMHNMFCNIYIGYWGTTKLTGMEYADFIKRFCICRIVGSSFTLCAFLWLFIFITYINNNVTIDRCSIPMNTTVRLGPLKCSLRATIYHHGPSIHSGHFTASINCCQKIFYCNDHTITEFTIIDSKNSSTAYVILYELIDTWFLDSNRRVGVWSLPWRWHIISIPLTTDRGTGAETCRLDDVFPPDDLCSRPEALC